MVGNFRARRYQQDLQAKTRGNPSQPPGARQSTGRGASSTLLPHPTVLGSLNVPPLSASRTSTNSTQSPTETSLIWPRSYPSCLRQPTPSQPARATELLWQIPARYLSRMGPIRTSRFRSAAHVPIAPYNSSYNIVHCMNNFTCL
jgi:hypothetical protein